jgi:cholesterol transport system auxiliary component
LILLASCSALRAPPLEAPQLYLLDASAAVRQSPIQRNLVLAVSMPRASAGFDTPQMAYQQRAHQLQYFAVNRWLDTPARMLEPLLLQALEQSHGFSAVVRTPSIVAADVRLDTELIRLQQDFSSQPSRVQLTLCVQLVDVSAKRVLASKVFTVVEDAPSDDARGGVIAANRLLQQLLSQVAEFCVSAAVKP